MSTLLHRFLFLLILLPISLSAYSQAPAIIDYGSRFHPVVSNKGMVVSQSILASQIGADMLAQGGNAIDAAVATGFALAVTLPQAGNIGGGGFMLVYLAEQKRTIAIDYREVAPRSAGKDLFLDELGEVDVAKARFSHAAAGVPGSVAGLVHALESYGNLPLATVLKPAITLAERGITVTQPLAYSLAHAEQRLRKWPVSQAYFFHKDGSLLRPGDHWQQKDLAATLDKIARQGKDGFYKGEVADKIVAEMGRHGGLISLADLANYKVIEREAVTGTYRGYTIAAMPPPSSGGVHLVQMLNVLEGWELDKLGHNSADYLHRLIETMRRAYADRSEYLGDPDFHPVPVKALTDKAYAKTLRAGIDLNKASASSDIAPGLKQPYESPQTTHFSVWDDAGNVVSNTYTLNFSYGSGIAVEGAGFLLNNEMDDFSAKPGEPNAYGLIGGTANAIEPNKRPLSSMTPTLVFKQGKPVFTTGSPGGSTIINTVLQTVLNVVDFDMNIAEAAAAPRIHHQWQPDKVFVEPGLNIDTRRLLEAKGHKLVPSSRVMGRTQTISSDGEYTYGANDTRWPGGGAVAQP
ncbi:gamma-glutamyltransferase [Gammaproteobacteria bacterium 50_400_T64]|nr:gamma-glutamyltransferase [Gammaproteobacteria bacterium 50_400_T64]